MVNQTAIQNAINEVIEYTNTRIIGWYENAKSDYGIVGAGKAHYNKDNNEVVVEYTENGESKTWSMAYYPEYLREPMSWVYNCWSELA